MKGYNLIIHHSERVLFYKTWYLTGTPIVQQKKRVPIRKNDFVNLSLSHTHTLTPFLPPSAGRTLWNFTSNDTMCECLDFGWFESSLGQIS